MQHYKPVSPEEAGFRSEPLPLGVCKRWMPRVLVGKHMREVPVFLGGKNELGEFMPLGTAFFLHYVDYGFPHMYLVTAKHVLDDIPGDIVWLRANAEGRSGVSYMEIPKKDWVCHPDHVQDGPKRNFIDVAVLDIPPTAVKHLETVSGRATDTVDQEVIDAFDIGLGDEVGIVGLFLSHIGASKNIAVLRIGNIAAMREEPVPSKFGMMDAYLVESRSIGGVSGSPVFVHMALRPRKILPEWKGDSIPWQEKEVRESPKPYFLLGMVSGYYVVVDQKEWVNKTHLEVGDINTGISIVVPSDKILEAIAPLAERNASIMKEHDRKIRERSGAKSASAASPSGAAPPASDENPTHREDFNRLLDVAARMPKQDE